MCDTWVALPDSTETQQVIFAKNSDRPAFDCQPLMLVPRREWPPDSVVQLEYIKLPQVNQTYAHLGSSPYWCWGYEEGINEYGVVIGNEAIYTKTFKRLANAYQAGEKVKLGLLGMDLIRLGLERASTAQQAVELLGALIEQYGQFGSGVPTKPHDSGGYDNSFIIADHTEAWVLEAVGKRWAAKRFTSGYTSISNQPTIRGSWDTGSKDVEAYARLAGWWQSNIPFDFARAYIDEETPRQVSHMRLMRSRQLLAEANSQMSPSSMMHIARDHYDDTFLDGPYFDAADPDFLSICMHVSPADFTWGNTASSCVAVLPNSEDQIPVFWWAPGPPCNSCYVPFFPHGSKLPEIVSTAGTFGKRMTPPPDATEDLFSPDSYWWLMRQLLDQSKGDPTGSVPGLYPERNRIIRERFDSLEAEFKAELPQVLARAISDGEINADVLDTFTESCVDQVISAIHELLELFGEPHIVS